MKSYPIFTIESVTLDLNRVRCHASAPVIDPRLYALFNSHLCSSTSSVPVTIQLGPDFRFLFISLRLFAFIESCPWGTWCATVIPNLRLTRFVYSSPFISILSQAFTITLSLSPLGQLARRTSLSGEGGTVIKRY